MKPSFRLFRLSYDRLGVTLNDALDMCREEDRTPENPVYCEAEEVFAMLPKLCDIRGGYAVFEADGIGRDFIRCGDKVIEAGRKVCGYMKYAESIAVFIGTAGEEFTAVTRRYNSEGDYLKGYLVDLFGSLVAERMAEFLQNKLEEEMAAKGLLITNRYSPGYCNWRLSGQKRLFEMLGDADSDSDSAASSCVISLTESMLMIPIKSVSGIIGVGHKVKKREYACAVCSDADCPYRRITGNN